MKNGLITAAVTAVGLSALVQPALACPNGYEAVWIQGNKVCKIKTPKLPLKAKQGGELKKTTGALKAQ